MKKTIIIIGLVSLVLFANVISALEYDYLYPPTAVFGRVFINGAPVQSGKVYCYKDGVDISQKPATIVNGYYGFGYNKDHPTPDVLICMARGGVGKMYIDTGSGLKLMPQTVNYGIGKIEELNLVDSASGCDTNCKSFLCEDTGSFLHRNCERRGDLYLKTQRIKTCYETTKEKGYYVTYRDVIDSRLYSEYNNYYFREFSACNNFNFDSHSNYQLVWENIADKCQQYLTTKNEGYSTKTQCEQAAAVKVQVCFDSDGGFNLFEKGSVVVGGTTLGTDYCAASQEGKYNMIEYSCVSPYSTSLAVSPIKCEYGCIDGACQTHSTIAPIPSPKECEYYWIFTLDNKECRERLICTDEVVSTGTYLFSNQYLCNVGVKKAIEPHISLIPDTQNQIDPNMPVEEKAGPGEMAFTKPITAITKVTNIVQQVWISITSLFRK